MAGLGSNAKMSQIRKKQYILLGGLLTIVAVIALVAGVVSTPKAPPVAKAPESVRKSFGAQDQVNNADFWRTQEGAKVSVLQQELGSMKEKLGAKKTRKGLRLSRKRNARMKFAPKNRRLRERNFA